METKDISNFSYSYPESQFPISKEELSTYIEFVLKNIHSEKTRAIIALIEESVKKNIPWFEIDKSNHSDDPAYKHYVLRHKDKVKFNASFGFADSTEVYLSVENCTSRLSTIKYIFAAYLMNSLGILAMKVLHTKDDERILDYDIGIDRFTYDYFMEEINEGTGMVLLSKTVNRLADQILASVFQTKLDYHLNLYKCFRIGPDPSITNELRFSVSIPSKVKDQIGFREAYKKEVIIESAFQIFRGNIWVNHLVKKIREKCSDINSMSFFLNDLIDLTWICIKPIMMCMKSGVTKKGNIRRNAKVEQEFNIIRKEFGYKPLIKRLAIGALSDVLNRPNKEFVFPQYFDYLNQNQ